MWRNWVAQIRDQIEARLFLGVLVWVLCRVDHLGSKLLPYFVKIATVGVNLTPKWYILTTKNIPAAYI